MRYLIFRRTLTGFYAFDKDQAYDLMAGLVPDAVYHPDILAWLTIARPGDSGVFPPDEPTAAIVCIPEPVFNPKGLRLRWAMFLSRIGGSRGRYHIGQ